jgi:DNA polymerase-3 subunit gamma/tau
VEFEPGALRAVARGAEGSLRDALSLLDQVLAFGGGRALEAEARSLLGTLDRRHVQGILTALSQKNGAELMRQAAHLDERAPDYEQALGELAAAVQRMALLQAVPELPPGDDEEEDALLRELAGLFAPDDLQLLYQIAINARRDLDYAPDARAGFEMALLRMLAFQPVAASAGGSTPPRPAATGGSQRATPTRPVATPAAEPVATPVPPLEPPVAEPKIVQRPVAPTPAAGVAADWPDLLQQLGLQGPLKQFAAHCLLLERKNGVVRLQLDPEGESYRRPQIEARLAQVLAAHFGETIRLEITVGPAAREADLLTPARREALAADDRQRAAEQAIETDPAVRAMRETFGAKVKPGSVKPLT